MLVKHVFLKQMPLMNCVTRYTRGTGIVMITGLCMNIMSTSHFLTNSSPTRIHQSVLMYVKLQAVAFARTFPFLCLITSSPSCL